MLDHEPSLDIRASEAADSNILNAPLDVPRPIPQQALYEKDRTIATLQWMLQKEKDEREKKEKELEREREDKVEMKRAIKLGLRFIRDERDWSHNSSPKISLRKTESVVA